MRTDVIEIVRVVLRSISSCERIASSVAIFEHFIAFSKFYPTKHRRVFEVYMVSFLQLIDFQSNHMNSRQFAKFLSSRVASSTLVLLAVVFESYFPDARFLWPPAV